ncbi:unnamed protein product [Didymodactylos carnosus]|uniref:Uncharacterized protein n=1 Tax=Didymodactylos carnosus TaxID=1234261 RepID=A0A814XQX8_9BILA|nr:unnamed protein product [Didymodactylos carnosus]CAF3982749.1 unnamed protein product [Didymodactylos carnosus]
MDASEKPFLTKLPDGLPVGGKPGRSTEKVIDYILYSYGLAIQQAIAETMDRDKQHEHCPDGLNSWYAYKRSLLDPEYNSIDEKKQKLCLDPIFSQILDKMINDLTNPELLPRCVKGLTQNSNESINSIVRKDDKRIEKVDAAIMQNEKQRQQSIAAEIATQEYYPELTATGSSVPGTKSLTHERPNSANCPGEQEDKRDFVEQLNELLTKQHRRQYSEEDILEKSRQMLEESKAKNDQLAEQAKVFQRTLQRNEIYSALNRFSYLPPIYPTVVKEIRSSSNRFQQINIVTRTALCIIGVPGQSKTLSFQIVLQNLQGAQLSAKSFCKRLPAIDPFFCLGSKYSRSENIAFIFERAIKREQQYEQNRMNPSQTTVFRMPDFPDDIDNELRNVEILSNIKLCMETGKTILMINTGRIHGSLYDVFNQNFSIMANEESRKIFSKVAIGPKTIDVVVHEDFQCIVHIKRCEFKDISAPFLSRFQKYSLNNPFLFTVLLRILKFYC